jgi:hypothetical protein
LQPFVQARGKLVRARQLASFVHGIAAGARGKMAIWAARGMGGAKFGPVIDRSNLSHSMAGESPHAIPRCRHWLDSPLPMRDQQSGIFPSGLIRNSCRFLAE